MTRALVVCDVASTLLDVAPTVIDLAGLSHHESFEGTSLRSHVDGCGLTAEGVGVLDGEAVRPNDE